MLLPSELRRRIRVLGGLLDAAVAAGKFRLAALLRRQQRQRGRQLREMTGRKARPWERTR
jgi:hypothetical protein